MKNMNINVRVKLGVNMASKLITAKYFVNNFSFTLQQLVVKYLNPSNIIVLVTFRPSRRNLSQLQINVQINNFHFSNFEFSAKEKV